MATRGSKLTLAFTSLKKARYRKHINSRHTI